VGVLARGTRSPEAPRVEEHDDAMSDGSLAETTRGCDRLLQLIAPNGHQQQLRAFFPQS
jgi:hypothetical protein